MSTALKQNNSSDVPAMFRAMDSEIPFLAAQASVEIDNLINESDDSVVLSRQLIGMLVNSIESGSAADSKKQLTIDPVSRNLLNKAYQNTFHKPVNTNDDLQSALKSLMDNVANNDKLADNFLESLRGFFIALSTYALSERQSLHNPSYSHPYKK